MHILLWQLKLDLYTVNPTPNRYEVAASKMKHYDSACFLKEQVISPESQLTPLKYYNCAFDYI